MLIWTTLALAIACYTRAAVVLADVVRSSCVSKPSGSLHLDISALELGPRKLRPEQACWKAWDAHKLVAVLGEQL